MSDKIRTGREFAKALDQGDEKLSRKIMMEVLLDIRELLEKITLSHEEFDVDVDDLDLG